ncbi:MAG: MerR family DNA-binding transcriptional regulator, partial [Enterococcus sp.]
MTMYSIGEFGKQIGVTPQTLRNWDKKGKLKSAHVSQGGTRYYSEEHVLLEKIGWVKTSEQIPMN